MVMPTNLSLSVELCLSAFHTSVERSTSIGLLLLETNNATLDINPELRNAADEWKMWLSNFEVFVDAIDLVLSRDKLVLFKSHVSWPIYKL